LQAISSGSIKQNRNILVTKYFSRSDIDFTLMGKKINLQKLNKIDFNGLFFLIAGNFIKIFSVIFDQNFSFLLN